MAKPGLSATDIGREVGASAIEINRLLENQGFLEGEPGAYRLTPKGEKLGVTVGHDNGYGGFAHRAWGVTYFDHAIFDALDVTSERLAQVREGIASHKEAQKAAREIAQAEAEERFRELQSQREADEFVSKIDGRKVLAVIGGALVVIGVPMGVYTIVQRRKRKRADKRGRDDRTDPGGA